MDPTGLPLFVVALNHLTGPWYNDIIQGADGLLNHAASDCRAYDEECLNADVLQKKYGGSWSAATEDFVAFAKSAHFNAAGYEFAPAPNVSWPYMPDLFVTNASHIFLMNGLVSFPDPWSAEFINTTDERIREWTRTAQHVNQPRVKRDVIGYYFEDQAVWDVATTTPSPAAAAAGATDWVEATRSRTDGGPGKRAYIAFLQSRYGDTAAGLAACIKAYNVNAPPPFDSTWNDLNGWDFSTVKRTRAIVAEDTLFLGEVAEQYFSIAANAVRRHDPGALVFGQRFLSNDAPLPVLAAAGRHFDVISVQPSGEMFGPPTPAIVAQIVETLRNMSVAAGNAPVFIADSSTHFYEHFPTLNGTDEKPGGCQLDHHGKLKPGTGCVANQTVAGEMYDDMVVALRATDFVVGYAHCQYINRAVCHEWPVNAPGHCTKLGAMPALKQGLLNYDGTPHATLVAAVARANQKVHAMGPRR